MSASSAHQDSHSEHPDPDLAEYRPVSGWGVAALLVGLASAGALAHPLLWCLPLCGVVVSLIALKRIAQSEIKLLGRKAALVGLAFSVIYGVAAPVRSLSREHWLAARAERLADQLIQRIRARQTDQAFDLTLQSVEKNAPKRPAMPGEPPRPEPASPQESFLAEPAVAKLLTLAGQARVDHLRTDILPIDEGRQSVWVLYEIHEPGQAAVDPPKVLVYVEQTFDADGRERWYVSNIALPTRSQL